MNLNSLRKSKDINIESDRSFYKKHLDEITALRGLAVILVIACHYEFGFFKAGFIGVDIFFVISGYLITGTLISEYNKSQGSGSDYGQISLKAFYLRRIRRIAPASTVTLCSVLAYYVFFGNPVRIAQVKSDFLWSITGFANKHFDFISADYFSSNNAQSPLLHF